MSKKRRDWSMRSHAKTDDFLNHGVKSPNIDILSEPNIIVRTINSQVTSQISCIVAENGRASAKNRIAQDIPKMSRLKLQWYNLEEAEGKDPMLKIPICDTYSEIIDRAFPILNHIGWREGSKGTCYTYLKNISETELENLREFLELLKQILCLTITDHLQPPFTDELTEAYAIDYTFKQDQMPLEYTNAGRVEHAAKTNQDARSIDALADVFAKIINAHPTLLRSDIIVPVPARPSSAFHLPVRLVEALAPKLGCSVGLDITKIEHPKLKTLPINEKILALEKAFTLRGSVRDKSVLIIDDLYQSGVTLWSLARFLKQNGATEVFGLACVKSWSDTDNV